MTHNEDVDVQEIRLVRLFGSDERCLGEIPKEQAEALASALGQGITFTDDIAQLGGPPDDKFTLPRRIVTEYPAPIAVCYRQLLTEYHAFTRVHRLIDTFEVTIQMLAVIQIQDFMRHNLSSPKLLQELLQKLPRPLTSAWVDLFHAARKAITSQQKTLFIPHLRRFKLQQYAQPLLKLRNQYAHSAVPSEQQCHTNFVNALSPLHKLLSALENLCRYPLIHVGENTARLMMGTEPGPWGGVEKPAPIMNGHLALLGERKEILDLYPLMIVENEQVTNLLPLFLYAGLREPVVEYLCYHLGKRIGKKESFSQFIECYLANCSHPIKDSQGLAVDILDTLFARHGKYEVLRLLEQGVFQLDKLVNEFAQSAEQRKMLGQVDGQVSALLAGTASLSHQMSQFHVAIEQLGTALTDLSGQIWADPTAISTAIARLPFEPSAPEPLPPLAEAVNRRLPTLFIGRTDERNTLQTLVQNYPLVTICGIGGLGKTALAQAVIADLEKMPVFAEGIYEMDLVGAESTKVLIERLANALGLPVPTGSPVQAARELAQGVGGRAVLVLLDNAEPVIDNDYEQVTQFVTALTVDKRAPHLLVTSRSALDLEPERLFKLPVLPNDDAEALLREAIAQRGGTLATETDLSLLINCALGHPLALKLIGSRVVNEGYEAVLTAAQRSETVFSLENALSSSWEAIGSLGQPVLAILALLPSGASTALLEAIGLNEAARKKALSHGMAEQIGERWRAHEIVRGFVASRLEPTCFIKAVAEWYLECLHQWQERFHAGEEQVALQAFRGEKANLAELIERLVQQPSQNADLACDLVTAAFQLYLWEGAASAGLRETQKVASIDGLEAEQRGQMVFIGATMAYFLGYFHQAVALAQQALTLLPESDTAQSHYILSASLRGLGDIEQAKAKMQRGLVLSEAAGDQTHHPNFLKELGVIADAMGHPSEGAELLRQAIVEYEQLDQHIGLSFAVQCLGEVERHRQHRQEAVALAERAIMLGQHNDEVRVQGYSHFDLAILATEEGRWAAAWKHLESAEAHFREVNHRSGVWRIRTQQAKVDLALGRFGRAWSTLQAAAEAFSQSDEKVLQLSVKMEQLQMLRDCGRSYEAFLEREAVLTEARQLGYPRVLAEALEMTALISPTDALTQLVDAQKIWYQVEDSWAARRCAIAIAQITHNTEQLEGLLNDAITEADTRAEAQIARHLAAIKWAEQQIDEAESWTLTAREGLSQCGTVLERWEIAFLLGRVLCARKQDDPVGQQLLRESIAQFTLVGDKAKVRAALEILCQPSTQETELLAFLSITQRADFLRTWQQPALAKLVQQQRVILQMKTPPKALVVRFTKPWTTPPGNDDIATLATYHLADVIRQSQ
ncbi:MAG: AAA family ATPase [Candidatus Parabeggiatoa sp.]|nr:AAA family ATPase [Candidatus Parabeggiatoa sp.]